MKLMEGCATKCEAVPDRVVWRFRFEFCGGRQPAPWWHSRWKPVLPPCPSTGGPNDQEAWRLVSRAACPSFSCRPPATAPTAEDREKIDPDPTRWRCPNCGYSSSSFYPGKGLCLNEACSRWDAFYEVLRKYLTDVEIPACEPEQTDAYLGRSFLHRLVQHLVASARRSAAYHS